MKDIKKSLKTVKLQDLSLYKDNPRHNTRSSLMVAKSIQKFGYIVPIVCNKDLVILAGNTRYKALKHLGIPEVEVIIVEGLTPDEEKEFVIADNRIKNGITHVGLLPLNKTVVNTRVIPGLIISNR